MQGPYWRRWLVRMPLLVVAGIAGLLLVGTCVVQACSIDGIASMKLNGYYAAITKSLPTKSTTSYWAGFDLGDASPGDLLQVSEDPAKLRKTLPVVAFKTPFAWRFGDGETATGMAVTHTYPRPGWYKIDVRYFWSASNRWVLFDSAQVHVVKPTVVAVSQSTSTVSSKKPLILVVSGAIALLCLSLVAFQVTALRQTR